MQRFPNKAVLKADTKSLEALIRYYESGGTVKVLSKAKRPKRGFTIGNPKSKQAKG